MNKRLAVLKRVAETSVEGRVFFYEASSNPVVSLYITTGSISQTNPNKKDLHLKYVNEPSTYPKLDLAKKTLDQVGYNKYKDVVQQDTTILDLSFDEYKIKFHTICEHINSAISQYHGIKCYEDGDSTNQNVTNVIILHICDVMNVMVCECEEKSLDLCIDTSLLRTIDKRMSKELDIPMLTPIEKDFFLLHIDFFYMCYAYVGNYSFVPIRTKIDIDSYIFKISSFFTNDDHFIQHQKGKLSAFNEREDKMYTKMIYRSI